MDDATAWVGEQVRYPQRLPRTVRVLDWSRVPAALQSKLEAVARTNGTVDYSRLPRSRWLRPGSATFTTRERQFIDSAVTQLRWPATVDSDETRLLTVVEGIVDRINTHPAWESQALGGRSVIALHMELHAYARAVHELLELRTDTPAPPTHAGTESYAHQEWSRRQAAFGRSRASLVNRAAALREVETGLDTVHRLAEDLRTTSALAAGAHRIDGLHEHLAGSALAVAAARGATDALADAEANLREQLSFLEGIQRTT